MELDEAVRAISVIPAVERETWIRVGMGLQDHYGDAGWQVWDRWSQTADNYDPKAARTAWRSFRSKKGITIATVLKLAADHGYRHDVKAHPGRSTAFIDHAAAREEIMARQAELEARLAAKAAEGAARMLREAEWTDHPYLAAKGFAAEASGYGTIRTFGKGMVLDGRLLIPLRDVLSSSDLRVMELRAVQSIGADGGKLFLPKGCAVKGCGFVAGARRPDIRWLCEGYATAISVIVALWRAYRTGDQVIACMSDHNLAHVAAGVRGKRIVVADNDPAGIKAAESTGLPTWRPAKMRKGADACDFKLEFGIDALARELQEAAR